LEKKGQLGEKTGKRTEQGDGKQRQVKTHRPTKRGDVGGPHEGQSGPIAPEGQNLLKWDLKEKKEKGGGLVTKWEEEK